MMKRFGDFYIYIVTLASLFLTLFTLSTEGYIGEPRKKCVEITVPMCRGIGYNMTSMPNQFNHQTQEEAGLEAHQFWPLVEINCSPDLKFFLCSVYTPVRMFVQHAILQKNKQTDKPFFFK